jgi:hypothetical protein
MNEWGGVGGILKDEKKEFIFFSCILIYLLYLYE